MALTCTRATGGWAQVEALEVLRSGWCPKRSDAAMSLTAREQRILI